MGSAITELLSPDPLAIDQLAGKIIAVDAHNTLYQFLTTIRMRDGTPLKDSQGNVTSHLIGLFNRTCHLLTQGLRLVYVFDGTPPEIKRRELDRRAQSKHDAQRRFDDAQAAEDVESMAKYASRTSRLTPEMAHEAHELLDALGVPWIEAPSEGEAQAAHMVARGDAYGVASQDADALLFGAPRIIKNLNISGKRKQAGKHIYQRIQPELITLAESLNQLSLTREQLIALAMLVGCDYAPGGAKGIGPKKAHKLVQRFGTDFDALFAEARWAEHQPTSWREVYETFITIPTSDAYTLRWGRPDAAKVREVLIERHDFSAERIERALATLEKAAGQQQRGLDEFT